jgi:hypothetical protein
MGFNPSQALGSFAGILVLGGALLLSGAGKDQRFDVIDAGRINIREPDGTLRLIISNSAQAPGIIIKGREQPHPSRASAGMIFYNDEGTENGDLIFDGKKTANGEVNSSGSLTFDRYEQDQVVQIMGSEEGSKRSSGIIVNDQPDAPMDFAAIERARALTGAARIQAFLKANAGGTQRAFVGRDEAGDSQIVLRDATGTKRLILQVTAAGVAQLQFLDAHGKVVRVVDVSHS